jgi:hypothetical protein
MQFMVFLESLDPRSSWNGMRRFCLADGTHVGAGSCGLHGWSTRCVRQAEQRPLAVI